MHMYMHVSVADKSLREIVYMRESVNLIRQYHQSHVQTTVVMEH